MMTKSESRQFQLKLGQSQIESDIYVPQRCHLAKNILTGTAKAANGQRLRSGPTDHKIVTSPCYEHYLPVLSKPRRFPVHAYLRAEVCCRTTVPHKRSGG